MNLEVVALHLGKGWGSSCKPRSQMQSNWALETRTVTTLCVTSVFLPTRGPVYKVLQIQSHSMHLWTQDILWSPGVLRNSSIFLLKYQKAADNSVCPPLLATLQVCKCKEALHAASGLSISQLLGMDGSLLSHTLTGPPWHDVVIVRSMEKNCALESNRPTSRTLLNSRLETLDKFLLFLEHKSGVNNAYLSEPLENIGNHMQS